MSQTATQIISTKMISVILGSSHPGGMFKSMCLGFVPPPPASLFFAHVQASGLAAEAAYDCSCR